MQDSIQTAWEDTLTEYAVQAYVWFTPDTLTLHEAPVSSGD